MTDPLRVAVVGAGEAPRDFAADGIPVEVGAVEQGGCGGIGHEDSSRGQMLLSSPPMQGPITTGFGVQPKTV